LYHRALGDNCKLVKRLQYATFFDAKTRHRQCGQLSVNNTKGGC